MVVSNVTNDEFTIFHSYKGSFLDSDYVIEIIGWMTNI